jgi:ribonuclease BN (tRNA processing enzyme)
MLMLMLAGIAPCHAGSDCGSDGTWLQVLGSGGPEATDGRASTGYLLWHDGKARVLVDFGTGSLLHYEQSAARIEDLDVVLISHFHVDHSNDLAGLVKASYFTQRTQQLPLFGPDGNERVPGASAFVQVLLGENGAYRYLADFLSGEAAWQLIPEDVPSSGNVETFRSLFPDLTVTALPVRHGPIPALAWRVRLGDRVLAFSGDMSGESGNLPRLAENADILVAHNAVPEGAVGAARALHMPPSVIGKIAAQAGVKQLVLSHRMNRTLGDEVQTLKYIRESYTGPVQFADDMQCFR